MVVETVTSFLVGTVASAVAALMLDRFRRKRHLHHLLWAAGLALWATTSFAQGLALVGGWNVPMYKLYYFSATALAGFLGAGTVGLIVRQRRVFLAFTAYILAASAVLGVSLALAPVDASVLQTPIVGGLALPSWVRGLAPWINIPGGIAFIGGAAYSFVRTRRLFALLITVGAAAPAVGGIFARLSLPWVLPFTDLIGIVCLSAGVLLSMTPVAAARPHVPGSGTAPPG